MKKLILSSAIGCILVSGSLMAQTVKSNQVPAAAVKSLMQKYPTAKKITWEKEHGNFEANWGGRSGEDLSVTFTPAGAFVEQVEAIKPAALPTAAARYLRTHYPGARINEAGKVTTANGKVTYEAEIKHKYVLFDAKGDLLRVTN